VDEHGLREVESMTRQTWSLALALGAVVAAASPAFAAASPADQFSEARRQCDAHVDDLRSSAKTLQVVAIIVATIGGLGAAASGLKAGSSEGNAGKRWGTVAFVSGVVAAAAPHLPKAQSFEDKLAMSDRHRIEGLKVERQLALLGDPGGEFQRTCAQYVFARYTDCLAEDAKDPPDLPQDPGSDKTKKEDLAIEPVAAPPPVTADTTRSPSEPEGAPSRHGGPVRAIHSSGQARRPEHFEAIETP
jgi:hypothetical protein